MELHIDTLHTPIGEMLVVVENNDICSLDFVECETRMMELLGKRYKSFSLKRRSDPCGVTTAIRAYFAGNLKALGSIPVATGGTVFQQKVWQALRTIAPATTLSYSELALQIGHSKAARAVGLANSLNPVALIVPCHRVIGASGTLTGYAGGLERKEWLLHHEKQHVSKEKEEIAVESIEEPPLMAGSVC